MKIFGKFIIKKNYLILIQIDVIWVVFAVYIFQRR